jgi:hypothetical protein
MARREQMRKWVPWGVGAVVLAGFAVLGNMYLQARLQAEILANSTLDATQAVELVAQGRETDRANQFATATQIRANYLATQAILNTPTLTPDPAWLFLADLTPVSVEVGHGSYGVGVLAMSGYSGQDISSHGKVYPNGLFTHAEARIEFDLPEGYSSFAAELAFFDGNTCEGGTDEVVVDGVVFIIVGDGETLYTSPTVIQTSEPVPVDVSIAGVSELVLIVDPLEAGNCDWAFWGDPFLSP